MEDQLEQIGYLDAQLNALGHTAIREEEITFEKKYTQDDTQCLIALLLIIVIITSSWCCVHLFTD